MRLVEGLQSMHAGSTQPLLAFDARIRCFPRFMPYGSFLIDDISFGKLGTAFYGNELAGQIGLLAVDPLDLPNTQVVLEYARIDPYAYSHRLNETSYTSNGFLLGDPIVGHRTWDSKNAP